MKNLREKPRYWVLRNREVVPTNSLEEWGKGHETSEEFERSHRVGHTLLHPDGSTVDGKTTKTEEATCAVSTVFLGIDHGWGLTEKPILFETLVFNAPGGGEDDWMERYATFEEAEAGHRAMIDRVKKFFSKEKQ